MNCWIGVCVLLGLCWSTHYCNNWQSVSKIFACWKNKELKTNHSNAVLPLSSPRVPLMPALCTAPCWPTQVCFLRVSTRTDARARGCVWKGWRSEWPHAAGDHGEDALGAFRGTGRGRSCQSIIMGVNPSPYRSQPRWHAAHSQPTPTLVASFWFFNTRLLSLPAHLFYDRQKASCLYLCTWLSRRVFAVKFWKHW